MHGRTAKSATPDRCTDILDGRAKMLPAMAGAALLVSLSAALAPVHSQPSSSSRTPACAPMNGYNFVCGVQNSEDLVPLPDTRWIIAGGRKAGAGIKLIDTEAKTAKALFTGEKAQIEPDTKMFPNCPQPPDPKTWISHGLFLRKKSAQRSLLYVVEDGPLQSIQIFSIDTSAAEPAAAWVGCVAMPEGNKAYANLGDAATSRRLDPNAVAAFSDGTILASIPRRPGTTPVERFNGSPTGDILEWKPGDDSFHVMQGVQVAYANGLEISPDESEFYVAAYSAEKIYVFSRQDPLMPVREVMTPGIMPDNIRWSGDRLIVAGMMFDEPACGGTQLALTGSRLQFGCHRGFLFAQLDPKAMTWKTLAYSEPQPEFNVVATGVIVGDTLWVGASSSDGVPYRALPHLPQDVR
jgi:hypothetical protein